MTGRLSPLQTDILDAFFRRERRFFLTGGAALAGFYLRHRETADLDLFTTHDVLADGEAALRAVAGEIGGTIENVQTATDFRRRLVRRRDDSVVVDLVFDHAPQGVDSKREFGSVRVDPPGEILANKLCTLLSRAEPRDLVDVMFLDRAGFKVEQWIALAAQKDAGLTAGQLAWVLSQITIGADAQVPGGVTPAELQLFLADLQRRLATMAFPA